MKTAFENIDLTDRYTLLTSLPKDWKNAVEIGVWEGWYTTHLILRTSMCVHAIDPWTPGDAHSSPDEQEFDPWARGEDGYKYHETRYFSTLTNLHGLEGALHSLSSAADQGIIIDGAHNGENLKDVFGEGGFVPRSRYYTVMRGFSYNTHIYFDDRHMDFVYIDGDHSYEAVKQDIADWWPKIKQGGILAGHDYNDTNQGTIDAVNEFAEQNSLNLKITGTAPEKGDAGAPSWVIIKNEV
jgi:hypothetical protein